jgi:hypothetical protein
MSAYPRRRSASVPPWADAPGSDSPLLRCLQLYDPDDHEQSRAADLRRSQWRAVRPRWFSG